MFISLQNSYTQNCSAIRPEISLHNAWNQTVALEWRNRSPRNARDCCGATPHDGIGARSLVPADRRTRDGRYCSARTPGSIRLDRFHYNRTRPYQSLILSAPGVNSASQMASEIREHKLLLVNDFLSEGRGSAPMTLKQTNNFS